MKAQLSWQILECCLKKMMLVITASASPVFWCSAPPADLRVSWLLLAPLTPLLSCVVIWWEKLLPTPPAYPHSLHYTWVSSFIIAIKVLYAGFSQKKKNKKTKWWASLVTTCEKTCLAWTPHYACWTVELRAICQLPGGPLKMFIILVTFWCRSWEFF